MKVNSSSGQSLTECLIALPFLFSAIVILAKLLYQSILYYGADYHLHEALMCTQDFSIRYCEDQLVSKLKGLLLFHEHIHADLREHLSSHFGKVEIYSNPPITIKKDFSKWLL